MRPLLLRCFLFVALLAGAFAAEKPNVLFLLADDLRPDALGAYGNAVAQTPHLDRLAREGMVFTRAHIMGGNSGAVCVPSRAMLLSGRTFFRCDLQLKDTPTWPQRLRAAGYATHATGKWHNGAASAGAIFPGARRVFLGGMTDQSAATLVDFDATGKAGEKRVATKHASEVFAEEAVRFLAQPHAQPWALYVAFTAPHDPRAAPPEWHAKFDPAKMPVPANFLPEHPFDNGELKVRDEQLAPWPRTRDVIQRHWADYHAILAHLDAQIGRILAALEKSGAGKNTLVVFAGDNGLALGSHGLMGKQNLYEHSIGVPLIVRGPGIAAGARRDALCYLLDLAPTLCDFAGTAPLENVAGRSLAPLLRGERTTHRDALLFAYRDVQRAVCDERWKAIWIPALDRWQLFDLAADPHERNDLASDPRHAPTLALLQTKLATLRAEAGDTKELRATR